MLIRRRRRRACSRTSPRSSTSCLISRGFSGRCDRNAQRRNKAPSRDLMRLSLLPIVDRIMSHVQPQIKVLPDIESLAIEAAERIIAAADEAIGTRASFSIALAGGSTPKALYQLLASPAFSPRVNWAR